MSFENSEDSVRALDAMNGVELDGRQITVSAARRQKGYDKTPGECKIC